VKRTLSVVTVVILGFGAGIVGAADPMADKEAAPTIGERLTKDTVKGTLMRMDGENYWVKDTDGKEIRLHVDTSTKLDKVVKGDKVKAYVTDNRHATTLQRDEWSGSSTDWHWMLFYAASFEAAIREGGAIAFINKEAAADALNNTIQTVRKTVGSRSLQWLAKSKLAIQPWREKGRITEGLQELGAAVEAITALNRE
jgi:hypothetical protein